MKYLFMKYILLIVVIAAFVAGATGQRERDAGIEHFRQREYFKAIEILEKLREEGKADYPSMIYLGSSYVKMANDEQAKKIFNSLPGPSPASTGITYDQDVKVKKLPRAKFGQTGESSGTVEVAVELKADGTLGFIFPFSTTSPKLIDPVLKAAQSIRFEPAIKDGQPVTVVRVFGYTFKPL